MFVAANSEAGRKLIATFPKSRSHNSFRAVGIGVSINGTLGGLVGVDGGLFKSTMLVGVDGSQQKHLAKKYEITKKTHAESVSGTTSGSRQTQLGGQ